MKIILCIEILGKKDSAKVIQNFDVSYIPFHNSIICCPNGPKKRLNSDIDLEAVGFNFRVDSKDISFLVSEDACLIESVDDTQQEIPLKTIIKEYTDCGWRVLNE